MIVELMFQRWSQLDLLSQECVGLYRPDLLVDHLSLAIEEHWCGRLVQLSAPADGGAMNPMIHALELQQC